MDVSNQLAINDDASYVAELIRLDRRRTTGATIDGLLLEGLNSGDPFEVTDEWWARKKEELRSRASELAQ